MWLVSNYKLRTDRYWIISGYLFPDFWKKLATRKVCHPNYTSNKGLRLQNTRKTRTWKDRKGTTTKQQTRLLEFRFVAVSCFHIIGVAQYNKISYHGTKQYTSFEQIETCILLFYVDKLFYREMLKDHTKFQLTTFIIL